jgi:transposase
VITKPVRDTHELEIEVHRYRCTDCCSTFRAYPKGVDRADRTLRLRRLAALAWVLGLSLEEIIAGFDTFDLVLSRTTIWRDGRRLVSKLGVKRLSKKVMILNNPGEEAWIDKHQGGVVIVLELKKKKKLVLEIIDEYDPEIVHASLKPIIADLGLSLEFF